MCTVLLQCIFDWHIKKKYAERLAQVPNSLDYLEFRCSSEFVGSYYNTSKLQGVNEATDAGAVEVALINFYGVQSAEEYTNFGFANYCCDELECRHALWKHYYGNGRWEAAAGTLLSLVDVDTGALTLEQRRDYLDLGLQMAMKARVYSRERLDVLQAKLTMSDAVHLPLV